MQHDFEESLTNAPPSWVGVPSVAANPENAANSNHGSNAATSGMTKEELDLSWARIGGALGSLNAITSAVSSGTAASTRKRGADNATNDTNEQQQQPKRFMPPTSAMMMSVHTWQCHLCKADNLDALAYKCGVCGIRKESSENAQQPQSQSLQTLTSYNNKQQRRRESFTSNTSSNDDSFTLDDLVHNLEGIEVEIRQTNDNNNASTQNVSNTNNNSTSTTLGGSYTDLYYGSGSTSGGAGTGARSSSLISENWNDSTSRLSTGQWSLQDLYKWSCQTCTFENEPFVCTCEMCGQVKPTTTSASAASVASNQSSNSNTAKAAMDNNQATIHAERIRALQEERMQELSQYHHHHPQQDNDDDDLDAQEQDDKPAALPTPSSTSTTPHKHGGKGKSRSGGLRKGTMIWSRGNAASPAMEDGSMGDFVNTFRTRVSVVDDLGKVRQYDPQDSQATASTYNMSQTESFNFSTDQFSGFSYPAGIEEAEEDELAAPTTRDGVY